MAEARTMFVAPAWIEAHCVVPDGFLRGAPFKHYGWQLTYIGAMYSVHAAARWIPENPIKAPAFLYRRGLIVGPQKLGKDPIVAAQICLEGVGPALFGGFAGADMGYACSDHGCRCGWEYPYDLGEPMGMAWPTPLIQITGVSEDATGNTYDALRPMIDLGPLADLIPKTGEDLIRLPGGGQIETVTSAAPSRLGQRTTHVAQGEAGLYDATNGMTKVADTQYRNLAGMSGRASLNTNAWDPARHSVAQREYESAATDVYRQFVQPPANLSFGDKRERRKILRTVYPADVRRENGGHADLDSIEAEAADLYAKDAPQAERFFGNRLVQGAGAAFDVDRWASLAVKQPHSTPDRALVTLGFAGSRLYGPVALVATEVAGGYQWPLEIWDRPEHASEWDPAPSVDAFLATVFERFDVWRLYAASSFWESWIATWAGRWGKDRVIEWATSRTRAMSYAVRSWAEAQRLGELSHCPTSEPTCRTFSAHVGNATRLETGFRDDGGALFVIEKPDPQRKIDADIAAILSWEARNDALTAGALHLQPAPVGPAFASY